MKRGLPHRFSSCHYTQLPWTISSVRGWRMKVNLLLVIVVFTQLVSAPWGTAQVFNPEEGSFLGVVRDSANGALPGVKVSAVNISTNLHREARILPSGLFGLAHLPRGIYRIHAEMPGFQTVIRVEAIEQGPYRVNLWVPAAPARDGVTSDLGVLTGTVRGFDNVSLPGVRITIRNSAAGKTLQVVSDARGNYSAADLPAGVFEIVAEREGFQPLRMGDVHLSGKFTVQLHLKLQPGPERASAAR
jgi:hypothetical protein